MQIRLIKSKAPLKASIHLPASKSESNRILLIKALCSENIELVNLSEADDTEVLYNILNQLEEDSVGELHVGHAGTSFRFLLGYLSRKKGVDVVLTGSDRLKQRPCGLLVDALRVLGADIEYLERLGYPPVRIQGRKMIGGKVHLSGGVSSQFISSLLLISPVLDEGLTIDIQGGLVSKPYMDMTINVMRHFGAHIDVNNNTLNILPTGYRPNNFTIESDWSAASYWYQMMAFAGGDVVLYGLKECSFQGDHVLALIFKSFGVKTVFKNGDAYLTRIKDVTLPQYFEYDCTDCPDIAQTIAVTCAGLGLGCYLRGLSTLKIKETDRIEALKNELAKCGVLAVINQDSLRFEPSVIETPESVICTYQDHRMAMAFAPLCFFLHEMILDDPMVVTKSYPNYWKDLENVGFSAGFMS